MLEPYTLKNSDITQSGIESYQQNGFLIVENAINKELVNQIKKETLRIFKGELGNIDGIKENNTSVSDYDILKKYLCIHFPHKLSDLIKQTLVHPSITNILTKIIGPDVKAMQSMLFVKGPGKRGQSWHQDEYYIPTRDRSLTGVWIALDDADLNNGCMWMIPGSHRPAIIYPKEKYTGKEFAESQSINVSSDLLKKRLPVVVKAGSVVFFDGYILHSSGRNRSTDRFRRALVFHYMNAHSMLPWDQDGKLPLTHDMRDIEIICGKDPYAYKGKQNLNKPYLRADPDAS